MLEDAAKQSTFCLEDTEEGYHLKHNHTYYYQVVGPKTVQFRN